MVKAPKRQCSRRMIIERIIILTASIILLYLLVSLYFVNHYFFHTMINGVNLSLKAHGETDRIIEDFVKDYKLQLIERNGDTEDLSGHAAGMKYRSQKGILQIKRKQHAICWIFSLLGGENYYRKDLFGYNRTKLQEAVMDLNCMKKEIQEPCNVGFQYTDGAYGLVREEYGNKINKDRLTQAILSSLQRGKAKLVLEDKLCYINPKYTLSSVKTPITRSLLNKYVSTDITYRFGNAAERLEGSTINHWLRVDKNLEVEISMTEIKSYVKTLSSKYDTVGHTRSFKSSLGKTMEIKGGLYGWKIDQEAEAKALYENIRLGEVLEKEPVYQQRALYRGEDEIGNTYVEINITKQHLWFYKNGKLVVHGSVVTGNPNRGNSTVVGTYMLTYKQKDATLKGPGYEAKVTYWMPFYGNIGIHDASWRNSFGGEIYKRNGTHGCINAPLYLAKKIYENIEEGIPIISYEE